MLDIDNPAATGEQQLRAHLSGVSKLMKLNKLVRPSAWKYDSLIDLVLQHGRAWHLPEEKFPLPKGERRGPLGECFRNAFRLAQNCDLRYAEGWAGRYIPVHHAWCVDADDRVIETTWRWNPSYPAVAYFGVVINISYMYRLLLLTERYGVLAPWSTCDMETYPLLVDDPSEWAVDRVRRERTRRRRAAIDRSHTIATAKKKETL